MNEILLITFKSDPWGAIEVSEKTQHGFLSGPECSLKENGPWLVGDRNSAAHDGDTKDMSRGRQVTSFVVVRSHERGRRGESKAGEPWVYIPLGWVPLLSDTTVEILEIVESLHEEGKAASDSSWFPSTGSW
jgi:hypothetical protein